MIEFSMLYVRNPTQREFTSLRQLQRHAVGVAQRARIVLLSAQPPAGRFQQSRLRWIAVVAASAGGYMLFRGLVSLGCSAKPLVVQLSK
ncbi:MAG: hypothetical protein ABIO92_02040 [Chloroflexia bacterium]